jgi:hypothetical protein
MNLVLYTALLRLLTSDCLFKSVTDWELLGNSQQLLLKDVISSCILVYSVILITNVYQTVFTFASQFKLFI